MKIQDIANLISVRDFTQRIINGIELKMTSLEVKTLRMKLTQMDRMILQHLTELDLNIKQDEKKSAAQSTL